MSHTATQAPAAAPDPPPTGERHLRYAGRRGERLLFEASSASESGTTRHAFYDLASQDIGCDCPGYAYRGRCWHTCRLSAFAVRFIEHVEHFVGDSDRELAEAWAQVEPDVRAGKLNPCTLALAHVRRERKADRRKRSFRDRLLDLYGPDSAA